VIDVLLLRQVALLLARVRHSAPVPLVLLDAMSCEVEAVLELPKRLPVDAVIQVWSTVAMSLREAVLGRVRDLTADAGSSFSIQQRSNDKPANVLHVHGTRRVANPRSCEWS